MCYKRVGLTNLENAEYEVLDFPILVVEPVDRDKIDDPTARLKAGKFLEWHDRDMRG